MVGGHRYSVGGHRYYSAIRLEAIAIVLEAVAIRLKMIDYFWNNAFSGSYAGFWTLKVGAKPARLGLYTRSSELRCSLVPCFLCELTGFRTKKLALNMCRKLTERNDVYAREP